MLKPPTSKDLFFLRKEAKRGEKISFGRWIMGLVEWLVNSVHSISLRCSWKRNTFEYVSSCYFFNVVPYVSHSMMILRS